MLYTANVGDARSVLSRNGRAVRLTYDHKGSDELEARRITENMKSAAAAAIAGVVGDDLAPDYIVPLAIDERVAPAVSAAVAQAARQHGVCRP